MYNLKNKKRGWVCCYSVLHIRCRGPLWRLLKGTFCRPPSCRSSYRSAIWFCRPTVPFPVLHPGKLSEMKSTWSPGPISHSQASLSHELWKVPQGPRSSNTAPSRPPPGLTNTKPSSTWGGNSLGLAQGWSSSYTTGSVTVFTKSFSRLSSSLASICKSSPQQLMG